MNTPLLSILLASITLTGLHAENNRQFFNYENFELLVKDSKVKREEKRLSEKEFLFAMYTGDYILLDARSKSNYHLRHIKGAINLPLTEFTKSNLQKVIPNKESKILIYCNNNFKGAPISFATKSAPASLNMTTQVHLRAYGYENIFELRPTIEIKTTQLPFVGTEIKSH